MSYNFQGQFERLTQQMREVRDFQERVLGVSASVRLAEQLAQVSDLTDWYDDATISAAYESARLFDERAEEYREQFEALSQSDGLVDEWRDAAQAQMESAAHYRDAMGFEAVEAAAMQASALLGERFAQLDSAATIANLAGLGSVYEAAEIARAQSEQVAAHIEALTRFGDLVDEPICAARQAALAYPSLAEQTDFTRAIEEAENWRQAREDVLGGSGLVSDYVEQFLDNLRDADRITDHLADHFGAAFPDYADSVRDFLDDVDLDAWRETPKVRRKRRKAKQLPAAPKQDAPSNPEPIPVQALRDDIAQAKQRALSKPWLTPERKATLALIVSVLGVAVGVAGWFVQPRYEQHLEDQRDARRAATAAAAVTVPAQSRAVVWVTTRPTPLHAGPHTRQPTMTRLPQGAWLSAVGAQPSWVRVTFVDPSGDGAAMTGWVRARHVERMEDTTLRLMLCALTAPPPAQGCTR